MHLQRNTYFWVRKWAKDSGRDGFSVFVYLGDPSKLEAKKSKSAPNIIKMSLHLPIKIFPAHKMPNSKNLSLRRPPKASEKAYGSSIVNNMSVNSCCGKLHARVVMVF